LKLSTLTIALSFSLSAQAAGKAPLFENDWIMDAVIEAPISRIMWDRKKQELDGTFVYTTRDGEEQKLKVLVRIRGRFRASKAVCDFAPLRVNFKVKEVVGTEFEGQDKLKLVTHCQNKTNSFEQLMLKEYMAYRIFAKITDTSFRTRLLRVTYIDSEGNSPDRTRYAFFIEHRKTLANRLAITPSENDIITFSNLVNTQANLVSVFSYLIGNTDIFMVTGSNGERCCHNVEAFKTGTGQYLPVPYDFDISGIVNPPYALPDPKFRIRKLTQRRYLGQCVNNSLLKDTFSLFLEHHAEISQMINDFEPLDRGYRKSMNRFVDSFYKEIVEAKKVEKNFFNECSGPSTLPI